MDVLLSRQLALGPVIKASPAAPPAAEQAVGQGGGGLATSQQDALVQRFERHMTSGIAPDDPAGPGGPRSGWSPAGGNVQGIPATVPAVGSGGLPNAGEAILRGLGALADDMQRVWRDIRRAAPTGAAQPPESRLDDPVGPMQDEASGDDLAGPPQAEDVSLPPGPASQLQPLQSAQMPTLGGLLAMQASMVKFAFLYEAVGKGTAKVIDNTNQLVKMQ